MKIERYSDGIYRENKIIENKYLKDIKTNDYSKTNALFQTGSLILSVPLPHTDGMLFPVLLKIAIFALGKSIGKVRD